MRSAARVGVDRRQGRRRNPTQCGDTVSAFSVCLVLVIHWTAALSDLIRSALQNANYQSAVFDLRLRGTCATFCEWLLCSARWWAKCVDLTARLSSSRISDQISQEWLWPAAGTGCLPLDARSGRARVGQAALGTPATQNILLVLSSSTSMRTRSQSWGSCWAAVAACASAQIHFGVRVKASIQ